MAFPITNNLSVALTSDVPNSPPVLRVPLEVSIVMPCLNEAETLAVCIAKARRSLTENGVLGEIIIADNGSADGSQALAERAGARVVHIPEKGYGSALLGGIAAAQGRYVIMGDADDSYDFANLMPFIAELRAGYELVMGNRFRGGIAPGAMPPLHRYLGNPVLTNIGRLFFRSPCADFHCGLRGFSKDAIMRLDLRTTGMEFASEMVVKATLHGLRIAEVPTTLSPDGRSRAPHLRSWRDGWRHLRFLLLYSPRWLFFYPALVLMLLGLTVGAGLITGPRTVGGVMFDVHTLVYAAAALVLGFQAFCFAVFTEVFAINEGLLPAHHKVFAPAHKLPLEAGLILGFLLILLGLGLAIGAVMVWEQTAFGTLNTSAMLRVVVPSVTALMLGFQTVLASFFLSALGLKRR